ncbi:XRE family transcriptional regulator [Lachnospiraceae bacterium]|nr:XRE family transcriptional regulator [Lachnospiraceae bacterium]
MKEINIGRILTQHRRKRCITQDALAEYMGVSKASVSKWETGTTYPDITLLPQLASFFNISMDELMGYEPQMTKTDIRRLCRQLACDFSAKPFHEVMQRCREITKKYFSCAPLLFQIGSLYVNHCELSETPQQALTVLEEAKKLFIRVKEESDDISLRDQALNMEAFCLLRLGYYTEVIDLLADRNFLRMTPEPLLAEAFQISGYPLEAKQSLQAGIYQIVMELLNLLLSYLALCQKDEASFEETCRRILAAADIFQLQTLHPSILLNVYYSMAQEYLKHKEKEKALDTLELYVKLAVSDIYPLKLKGDSYFTLLDGWLEENLPLGCSLPREETLVRKSMITALTKNPAFHQLFEEKRFQDIVRILKNHRRNNL